MSKSGFTLFELTIVMVIIALLIGGIMVGQSLMRQAADRAAVSEYERYNTVIDVFAGKYGGLPGDIQNASRFGLIDRSGSNHKGNGNRVLEDCSATSTLHLGCETAAFWVDLSQLGLLGEGSDAGAMATVNHTAGTSSGAVLPRSKSDAAWQVYGQAGINYFHLSAVDDSVAGPGIGSQLTPISSYNIDSKIDDGMPDTGIVLAVLGRGRATVEGNTGDGSEGTETDCDALDGSTRVYNTDNDTINEQELRTCQLLFKIN